MQKVAGKGKVKKGKAEKEWKEKNYQMTVFLSSSESFSHSVVHGGGERKKRKKKRKEIEGKDRERIEKVWG